MCLFTSIDTPAPSAPTPFNITVTLSAPHPSPGPSSLQDPKNGDVFYSITTTAVDFYKSAVSIIKRKIQCCKRTRVTRTGKCQHEYHSQRKVASRKACACVYEASSILDLWQITLNKHVQVKKPYSLRTPSILTGTLANSYGPSQTTPILRAPHASANSDYSSTKTRASTYHCQVMPRVELPKFKQKHSWVKEAE